MTTISETSASGTTGYQQKKTGPMQEMGKDAFLQLLVTQLRHQDPLNPQDNSAFVAQMAQFTTLEQMQNMNTTMGLLFELQNGALAPAFLDREVIVADHDGNSYRGRVEAVEYFSGRPWLVINDTRFGLETLQVVLGANEAPVNAAPVNESGGDESGL